MSKLSSKFYRPSLDQQGKEIKFDVREDEDQDVKLQETIELLVAAGYFRARIKGLSSFDKIVGGMTWCIETCNFDVDVDLLFVESSTIGQKITLTERIVKCLPKMKCPHRIEPHQIQGLDFIHIYPVVQWLVKKAIETRAEMGDLNRNYALLQFTKLKCEPISEADEKKVQQAIRSVCDLKSKNQPQRKFLLRRDAHSGLDKQYQVQSTLLEYGQQNILLANLTVGAGQTAKSGTEKKSQETSQASAESEKNLKRLMNEMAQADKKQNKVSASAVGQILGFQQNDIKKIADEFALKESELQQSLDNMDETTGGVQHKQRMINMLKKQVEHKEKALEEKRAEIKRVNAALAELGGRFTELKGTEEEFRNQLGELVAYEENHADKKAVDKLQKLVVINDELKQKEQEFKKGCKRELAEIEEELVKLKASLNVGQEGEESDSRMQTKIGEQYEAAKAKMHAVRLKVAKRNREISSLQRRLDELPSRVELSQYQKRFVELYNQISGVHTQTKQFYIFYNVLEDKKLYMNKEINLLNSIHEQYERSMSTPSNREQFVKQLEAIVGGITNNLGKVESKRNELKRHCDDLNDRYNALIDKKRAYYKVLKDFQEECKRNELLLSAS